MECLHLVDISSMVLLITHDGIFDSDHTCHGLESKYSSSDFKSQYPLLNHSIYQ